MTDREDTQGTALGVADTVPAPDTPAETGTTSDLTEPAGAEPTPFDAVLREIARIDEVPSPLAERVGTRLAHFEVLAELGRGGMGVVYLAFDHRLGRKVALKLIRGDDPNLTVRLFREARAQARVDHPNVCKVYDVGAAEGKAYIAMELVDGRRLDEAARGMSLPEKVQVVRDVARALHEAHVLGIVHRDVKPSNILVETLEDGALRPVVMDFGIARDEEAGQLTQTGAMVGTPAYMSPEQARGDRQALDRRSDVYSLGATFYELLAGEPPFRGEGFALIQAVLTEDPPPLRARVGSLPEDLGTIVGKCLRRDPGERYDSAHALAEDLERYIRGEPILGRRESVVARLRRRAKDHRALVLTGALAACALVTAGGLAVRARVVAQRQAAELAAEAALGRELGQEVKEMEWSMRSAKLLPLHDLTRERAAVKERMKRIEARPSAGPMAAAMVDDAVGRGHLALDEYAEAATRLESAERGGLDTPELHYALGVARGRLYQQALDDTQRLPDKQAIERRQRELEQQYLKPAAAEMEKSRDVGLEAPSYLPGLLALYQKDYDGALRLARKAQEEAPSFYEAVALQADVLVARSEDAALAYPDARVRDLEEAARLYDVAAESGRSDASLYLGSATAQWRLNWMHRYTHTSLEDSVARASDRCEKAAIARPDTSEPYLIMGTVLENTGEYLLAAGADPRPVLVRALDALDRARAVGGDSLDVYVDRAFILEWRAQYEMSHGLDPSASLDQSVADARRAVDLAPTNAASLNALGIALGVRALHVTMIGGDPERDLHAALDTFRSFKSHFAFLNSILVYGKLAERKITRGQDPSEEVAQAAEWFGACVKAAPDMSACYLNMGRVERALSEYRALAGSDPREALSHAVEHLEKARTLSVEDLETHQELAAVHLLQAEDASRRGEDSAPALAAFDAILTGCYRVAPKDPICTRTDARRSLLLADVAARAHRPERPSLDRAVELAGRAVEGNVRDADTFQVLADAERRIAALAAAAAEQAEHRSKGIDACTRGLAVNPNHPRLLAAKGALLLLEARAAHDAAAKRDAAKEALSALRRAVELNPLLRREVGELLDEAGRLSG